MKWMMKACGLSLLTAFGCSAEPSGEGHVHLEIKNSVIRGVATDSEWHGMSLSKAGDINGDGIEDVIVTALSANVGGRALIFAGPMTQATLKSAPLANIQGEFTFSNLGESLTQGGGCDLNGDGKADVLLGAPFADVEELSSSPAMSGDNGGKAYVFFGGDMLKGTQSVAQAQVQFLGEDRWDAAGSTVACLGDLDGDGFDDVAIAARRNSRGAKRAGSVYLFYGRASWQAKRALQDADAIFVGEQAFDGFGVTLSKVEDLNGDGRPEIAIGAPMADQGGDEAGRVYLAQSQKGRWSGQISAATLDPISVDQAGLRFGSTVAPVGDVDGDGRGDFIVGTAPVSAGVEGDGAWLVLGGTLSQGKSALVQIVASRPQDRVGQGVGAVGDLDGDGFDEFVLGAPQAERGQVYLMRGRASWPSTLEAKEGIWSAIGERQGTLFGENITALGPDKNGATVFLVSERRRNLSTQQTGLVHIYWLKSTTHTGEDHE